MRDLPRIVTSSGARRGREIRGSKHCVLEWCHQRVRCLVSRPAPRHHPDDRGHHHKTSSKPPTPRVFDVGFQWRGRRADLYDPRLYLYDETSAHKLSFRLRWGPSTPGSGRIKAEYTLEQVGAPRARHLASNWESETSSMRHPTGGGSNLSVTRGWCATRTHLRSIAPRPEDRHGYLDTRDRYCGRYGDWGTCGR